MTALTDVFVRVLPDMDKFGPEVKSKLQKIDTKAEGSKVAGRFGVGFNGAFGGIVKHSTGLFIGAFAAIKGAQVFGSFISDAQESAKISRITANAIRATGGAAHITADQVGELATSISNKTAIDDEAVQSAANMLLTFKNIRNETGKNNDIFNRATQAAADLSVQFGGIDGASKQLGKALNDPIKGISALSKAGVTFTEQQKKQIKTLTESGNVLGAQKIILKEIEGQVGGAAAAAADPIARLKVVAGNLAEEVGGFLLPTVSKFAGFISDKAIPALSSLFGLFKTGDFTTAFREAFHVEEDSPFVSFLLTVRETAISVFNEVKGGIVAFAAAWKYNDGQITSSGFPGFMERLGFAARQAFGFFKTEVIPRLKDFAGFVAGTVVPAVGNLIASFRPLAQDVGTAAVGVFEKVVPLAKDLGSFISGSVVPAFVSFTGWLKQNSTLVGSLAIGIGAIVAAYKLWQGALFLVAAATKAYAAVQAILNAVMAANPIGLVVLALVGLAAGLVYAYKKSETFRNIVNGVWSSIQTAAQFMWNSVLKPIFSTFVLVLQGVWKTAQTFSRNLSAAWNAIKEPARVAIHFVVTTFLDMVSALLTGAAKAFGWVPGLGGKLRTAATEFGKFRDSVNTKLSGITDQTIKITPVVLAAQTNRRNKNADKLGIGHATGGAIFGPGTGTSDSIPALLSNGEHVWTAKEVQKAGGHGAVEQMRQSVMKYAKGGAVSLDVSSRFPSLAGPAQNIAATASAVARPIAQTLANALAKINPGLSGVLSFVRSQVGKPYLWGGVGPGGYDCSGLVSAAINTAFGRNPYRRLGATGSMPWGMFAPGPGAFEVGWFKGNPGHTAATVNGVNIESRGGRGVLMGGAARGARSGLFTNRAHVKGFARGGQVGDAPYDTLHNKKQLMKELGVELFDQGGQWKSGTIAANLSGKTETVRTAEQERSLQRGQVGLLTITNWQEGTGHFRLIARDEIGSENEFNNAVGRMHR